MPIPFPTRVLAGLALASTLLAGMAMGQEGSVTTLETAPGAAAPRPCGTQPITIARMPWPSAAILAEVHALLLAQHYDCVVRIQQGDLAPIGSSMATSGQPAVAPELWISRIAEVWNPALRAQSVRQAGPAYEESRFEGWFVPDYVLARFPELSNIAGIREGAAIFARDSMNTPEPAAPAVDPAADAAPTAGEGAAPATPPAPAGRGRFISCPIDWACSVVNRNLLAAHGLAASFDIVEPANRFELDTLLAEAFSRQEPILFYYWQPNAVLAQFDFTAVELGDYDPEAYLCLGRTACVAPEPTAFPPEPVVIALAEWVFAEAPQVASYFQRAQMPMGEMNALLLSLSEGGATVETAAETFVAEREEIWSAWVGAPQ
ncbi:hypothetical protein EMQ25_14820 [Arsenicitalea aurantiaca]|uniref:ABC-type glycine betaine transport system substrate-binding domain-containing protein n=1 Tax=Arsenicitalea aurantiaca TaxID=1783274 RepID=A0A433X5R4_9HYPH|nr:glycine betaine ABC transporter substrate-binding protein [Arsenicitalea aurantiaca]RUT29388.1 hypothetical protein EMQ25_14820 [Arsenicitalea aurantiaca]